MKALYQGGCSTQDSAFTWRALLEEDSPGWISSVTGGGKEREKWYQRPLPQWDPLLFGDGVALKVRGDTADHALVSLTLGDRWRRVSRGLSPGDSQSFLLPKTCRTLHEVRREDEHRVLEEVREIDAPSKRRRGYTWRKWPLLRGPSLSHYLSSLPHHAQGGHPHS